MILVLVKRGATYLTGQNRQSYHCNLCLEVIDVSSWGSLNNIAGHLRECHEGEYILALIEQKIRLAVREKTKNYTVPIDTVFEYDFPSLLNGKMINRYFAEEN